MEIWQLIDEAKELHKECNSLTEYEALQLVIGIQRNYILKYAFWTRTSNKNIFEDLAENISEITEQLKYIEQHIERKLNE